MNVVMRLAGVDPGNILLVENTTEHVDEAKKMGWQTFLYDPSDVAGSNRGLKDKLL